MASADMFLKIPGITGETNDPAHKGEIELLAWNWGAHAAAYRSAGGSDVQYTGEGEILVAGRPALRALDISKRIDRSTPNLIQFLDTNKNIPDATLTARKASGGAPFEYLSVKMQNARIVTYYINSAGPELIERVSIAFMTIEFIYTPQGTLGVAGAGAISYKTQARAV